MVRIWFNHWFSAVYNIIEMMREGCKEDLYVIGSNRNAAAVYKSSCNEWYTEPDKLSEDEYVDFCLDFCNEHEVDVFVPRRELTGASMPINIQLRMHEGRMLLLEINPRMSGGMQLSCAASGINVPAIALNQLIGYETIWQYPAYESKKVAHVERAICFD